MMATGVQEDFQLAEAAENPAGIGVLLFRKGT